MKGTWYTNTRSLIENGKSTGLCTIAKTGAGTSSLGTLSWGGSSWWPLYGISQLASGNTGTTFNVVTRIDGVSKIASLSWSGSTTSQSKYASVTLGFWVCGDILIDAWGWTSNPSFRMEVLLYVSGEWCSGAWSSTATWMPATATAHTYTTATIPAMDKVTTTKGQYMVAWTDGASTGSIFICMMRPNTGVSPSWVNFGYTIWAKNLWLDTSHTVSV